MSAYRKFIDSATKTKQPHQSPTKSPHKTSRVQFQDLQQVNGSVEIHNYNDNNKNMVHQHHQHLKSASSYHLGGGGGGGGGSCSSTVQSTPVSKQHYKRLVSSTTNENLYHPMPQLARQQSHQTPATNYCSQVQICHHGCCSPTSMPKSPPTVMRHQIHSNQQQQQQIYQNNTAAKGPAGQYQQVSQQQQQRQQQQRRSNLAGSPARLDSVFRTDDPIMLRWLQAMRFETELECLTALQARTLAIDEHSAGALSVRNSQVNIQEIRAESSYIIDFIDYLIELVDSRPLGCGGQQALDKFTVEFSELWTRLMAQTSRQTSGQLQTRLACSNYSNQMNTNLTIVNCTPRKSALAGSRTLRPLDKLAQNIRELCLRVANQLNEYQEEAQASSVVDSNPLAASLRRLLESYGEFIQILIRAECANIVRALDYNFSNNFSNGCGGGGSSASLQPVRPFESSSSQLPLKWALMALWLLTKDDSYICRTLTEKWQTAGGEAPSAIEATQTRPRAAKRLDYSTKYEATAAGRQSECDHQNGSSSLRSDYERLHQICQNDEEFKRKQRQLARQQQTQVKQGALSSALKLGDQQKASGKQISTIELLIDVIISQPNKHERLDMMNLIHQSKQSGGKLIDLDELDQSVSAAIYTSNQYKVAALRILNHLCVIEQAVKTILKCFYTPPPSQGGQQRTYHSYHYLMPENKIIRSIFECYQTSQEHIYQNETMFQPNHLRTHSRAQDSRKRARSQMEPDYGNAQLTSDEYSDYGSRQTLSIPTSMSTATTTTNNTNNNNQQQQQQSTARDCDQSEDEVVKEALRLLIQLTNYFYRSNQGHDYYNLIGQYSIDSLVKYLTNIIKSTGNREMLLLSLIVLANISFITTEPLKQYGTNGVILEMFRTNKRRSKDLELRDQAVTIIANTVDKNLLDIVSKGGITFLLSCLETCPTKMTSYKQSKQSRLVMNSDGGEMVNDEENRAPTETNPFKHQASLKMDNKPRDRKPVDLSDEFLDDLDCVCDQQQITSTLSSTQTSYPMNSSPCLSRLSQKELAALERIHQKTAVAFARISVDPSTIKMVETYGGIKQMIDLCKFSHKRNYSDSVLEACIAALRKIAKVTDRETFRHYNALDLIELEFSHTFEIYRNSRNNNHTTFGRAQSRMYATDV